MQGHHRDEDEETNMSKVDNDNLNSISFLHLDLGVIKSLKENIGRLSKLSVTKNRPFIKTILLIW